MVTIPIYIRRKYWLVGDHLILSIIGIIFMYACVVITVVLVMLLKDFGPYIFCSFVSCLVIICFLRTSGRMG
jgi:hypothetical protein